MKPKSLIYLFIAFALTAAAGYFIYKRKESTVDPTKISFAVFDVSVIERIVITDGNKVKADLKRTAKNDWIINSKFRCRKDNMDVLLDGIRKMRIKYPVPKGGINTVLADIATTGIKVEIYNKENDLIKAYYIGRETNDMSGNNALLINEKNGDAYEYPIVIEIPGFNGYLSPRFFANENLWRDITIFETEIDDLKKVEVKYSNYADSSFVIENLGNNNFTLKQLNQSPIVGFDTNTLKRYLIYYREAAVMNYVNGADKKLDGEDSIAKSTPIAVVSITTKSKGLNQFAFFNCPIDRARFPDPVEGRVADPEVILVRLNEPKEFAYAQYTNLGKWLQTWAYFMPEVPVKKF
jgi:hypothetical protein